MPSNELGPNQNETESYFGKIRREIEPLLPESVGSVLEIGCGAGGTLGWLRTIRDIRYAAGVEMMPEAGKIARTKFDDVEIGDINAVSLAFKTNQFDLILALDVLEHVTDPATILRRLREKLRPNGLVIASIPNVAHYQVAIPLLFRGRWEYRDEGLLDRTHLRFFTEKTALSLFRDCGFSIVGVNYTKQFPNVLGWIGLSDRSWRWYNHKLLRHILRWPKHLFNFQFLIAARKLD
jgi:SAM-dependent methyltransferase